MILAPGWSSSTTTTNVPGQTTTTHTYALAQHAWAWNWPAASGAPTTGPPFAPALVTQSGTRSGERFALWPPAYIGNASQSVLKPWGIDLEVVQVTGTVVRSHAVAVAAPPMPHAAWHLGSATALWCGYDRHLVPHQPPGAAAQRVLAWPQLSHATTRAQLGAWRHVASPWALRTVGPLMSYPDALLLLVPDGAAGARLLVRAWAWPTPAVRAARVVREKTPIGSGPPPPINTSAQVDVVRFYTTPTLATMAVVHTPAIAPSSSSGWVLYHTDATWDYYAWLCTYVLSSPAPSPPAPADWFAWVSPPLWRLLSATLTLFERPLCAPPGADLFAAGATGFAYWAPPPPKHNLACEPLPQSPLVVDRTPLLLGLADTDPPRWFA